MSGGQRAAGGDPALFDYLLRLGDSSLILAQQLAAWTAAAPELEEDVALINVALDLLGQARALLTYAGEVEGAGRSEDQLAFLRDTLDWRNVLLVEQDNGDFARTMARQYLIDAYHLQLYEALQASADTQLAAIAAKSLKEVKYHYRHSSQWLLRLGDGTVQSHARLTRAFEFLWPYTGELFAMDDVDRELLARGIAPDLEALAPRWREQVLALLGEATVAPPADTAMQGGGKQGRHTEALGYVLAEMQFMQRAYPGCAW